MMPPECRTLRGYIAEQPFRTLPSWAFASLIAPAQRFDVG